MIVTYRVFLEENQQYTVRELFCDHDGRPLAYGKAAIIPRAGSLQELGQEIALLQEALALPVLTIADVEAAIGEQPVKVSQKRKTFSHAEVIAKLGLRKELQAETEAVVG